jgi:hypothetical protein
LENESQKQKEFAKNALFKLWDKQKSMNKVPTLNTTLSQSLGISFYELQLILIEWYGGIEKIFKIIKGSLGNKIITTNDLQELGIDAGGYDFSFKLLNMKLSHHKSGGYEINSDVKIIDGGVTTITDGEYIDLTNVDLIDGELWWEISWEIKDLINDLIRTITDKYGFNSELENISINYI